MNTAGVERIVKMNQSRVPKGNYLGIGTVCNTDEASRALDAGAAFIVTPNTDAMPTEINPTVSEMREPNTTRLNTSRPN